MKKLCFVLLLFVSSFCKGQTVMGPSVINWGGSVGYGFDPSYETYVWGTWVNYEFDRRKKVSPLVGFGIQTWNTSQTITRYYVPQAQVGIVTKNGMVSFVGYNQPKTYSYGLGFYSGYQQFRLEYNPTLKTMMFGCGYVIK